MSLFKKWILLLAVTGAGAFALAASAPKFVCGLTEKESKSCCCESKDGKLLCQYTGKLLDACCCEIKP